MRKKPFVFLVNKQDSGQAVNKEDIKRILHLDKRHISNPFTVKPATSMTGEGWNIALTFIETHKQTRTS